jgi:hypothetical protein
MHATMMCYCCNSCKQHLVTSIKRSVIPSASMEMAAAAAGGRADGVVWGRRQANKSEMGAMWV